MNFSFFIIAKEPVLMSGGTHNLRQKDETEIINVFPNLCEVEKKIANGSFKHKPKAHTNIFFHINT